MKQTLKLVVGSCAVYVIVAACSGGGNSLQNTVSLGGSGNTGVQGNSGTTGTSNGSGGTLNGSGGGSILASGASTGTTGTKLTDAGPVPDAMAQTDSGTIGPQVNSVACDTTITSGSNTSYYAVMSYPGRTVAQLASIHAVGALVTSTAAGTHSQASVILQDGTARVNCGLTTAKVYSSVIFVLP
jgi:hypothetical protein